MVGGSSLTGRQRMAGAAHVLAAFLLRAGL